MKLSRQEVMLYMSILGKILLFRGRSLSTVSMYVSLGLIWPDVLEIEEEFEIMYLLKFSIICGCFIRLLQW